MAKLRRLISRLVAGQRDEGGQALVEYALILGLVSIVALAILTTIGGDVVKVLEQVESALASAV